MNEYANPNEAVFPSSKTSDEEHSLYALLADACADMSRYAVQNGLRVPSSIIPTLERIPHAGIGAPIPSPGPPLPTLDELNTASELLKKAIEPACPQTVQLLAREQRRRSFFRFLSPIPMVRRLMAVSILSLSLFILLSLTPHVDATPENWGAAKSFGHAQLIRELFLLSAAILGAAFAALYRINRFISQNRYNPSHEGGYWVNLTVGGIAGLILAILIPIEQSIQADLAKPMLAMLGGFSAEAVYKILSRLVESVSSFVGADHRSLSEFAEREHHFQLHEIKNALRLRFASDLLQLRKEISEDLTPSEIKQKLSDVVARTMEKPDEY